MTLKNAASDANDVFLCTSILAVVACLKAVICCVKWLRHLTQIYQIPPWQLSVARGGQTGLEVFMYKNIILAPQFIPTSGNQVCS